MIPFSNYFLMGRRVRQDTANKSRLSPVIPMSNYSLMGRRLSCDSLYYLFTMNSIFLWAAGYPVIPCSTCSQGQAGQV